MGWQQYTKAEKIKVVVSSLGLLTLITLFVWGMFDEKGDVKNFEQNGKRTIGVVIDKYKSYKGGRRLKYYFHVNGNRFEGTKIRDTNHPTEIDDKRVVVYDPENPKSSRMLLHEPLRDSSDLKKYIGLPIVVHPD